MDLNNSTLVEWLRGVPSSEYPQGKKVDHHVDYDKLAKFLNEKVHKEVTIGANLKDPELLLNDHGPDHINTVISRASYLVDGLNFKLSPYEVYILLCCIQLHDVGNIFGRYQHEINAENIMKEAEGICGTDTVEAIMIKKIASAHGGRNFNGDKDKISELPIIDDTLHGELRSRLIAGILRFADELADDKTRANATLLKQESIPKASEVYHAYAMCLDSVKVKHEDNAVYLNFKVPKSFLLKKFGKMKSEIYLLDEIYNRVLKMHYERIYCMRFCRNFIELNSLFVNIEFYDNDLSEVFPKISFEIRENGYPKSEGNIFDMCKELIVNGNRLDADYIKSEIEKK